MKRIRQKAILELVRNRQITSQEELLESLQALRIDVSQSTLSRDIQELRLAKTGGIYAVVDHEPPHVSDESVRRTLREYLLDAAAAQNIVVLKTGSGQASVVSQAIDDAGWAEVVGSIAGENTVFVAVTSMQEASQLRDRILGFLK